METRRFCLAELRAIPADVDETRTMEFVISNERRDRHGTVLRAAGWKLENYKKNPVVGYAHALHGGMFTDPDPDMVIGRSEVFQEGKNLIGRVTFEPPELNPVAEKIFQKLKFGSLRTASVGFIPTGEPEYGKGAEARGGKNETLYFPGQELLEWSIVNIPSNPSAAKRDLAEEIELFYTKASEAVAGKMTPEELRKMSIDGIVKLMTGESVEKDEKEREQSQEIDQELALKVRRQIKQMDVDLSYFDNEGEVSRMERVFVKEKRALLEGFDRDFSIVTPEDQLKQFDADFQLNDNERE